MSDIFKAAIAIPTYEIDKVVTALDFQVPIADTVAIKSTGFATALGDDFSVVGVYSYNGGTTFYDFGNYNLPTGLTIAPPVAVSAYVATTGFITFTITQTALVNGGSPYSLNIRVACIVDDPTTADSSVFFVPGNTSYTSDLSYMKVALKGNYSRSASSAETRTIAHNLGYVPSVAVDLTDSSGRQVLPTNFGLSGTINYGVRADATNIYISTPTYTPTQTITVDYRIYFEN